MRKESKFQRDYSAILASAVAIFGHDFVTYVAKLLCYKNSSPWKRLLTTKSPLTIWTFIWDDQTSCKIFLTLKRISSEPCKNSLSTSLSNVFLVKLFVSHLKDTIIVLPSTFVLSQTTPSRSYWDLFTEVPTFFSAHSPLYPQLV